MFKGESTGRSSNTRPRASGWHPTLVVGATVTTLGALGGYVVYRWT